MHNNHYDVITKMPGFFARHYYCHACKKAYDHLEDHVCPNKCKCCGFFPICPEESWRSCRNCRRQFKSQRCYDQHKQSKGGTRPICVRLIKCTKCGQHVPRYKQMPEKHRCGQKKCGICGKYVRIEGHHCYIQPETKRKTQIPRKKKKCPKMGTTCRPFSTRNVDRASENPRTSRSKNP